MSDTKKDLVKRIEALNENISELRTQIYKLKGTNNDLTDDVENLKREYDDKEFSFKELLDKINQVTLILAGQSSKLSKVEVIEDLFEVEVFDKREELKNRKEGHTRRIYNG